MAKGFDAGFPLKYSRIEKLASGVRTVLHPDVPLDQPIDCLRSFERAHFIRIQTNGRSIPVDIQVQPFPGGLEALSVFRTETGKIELILSEDTYRQLEIRSGRAGHTFCHEIGHIVLHTDILVGNTRIPHIGAALARGHVASHPTFRDTEWQADAFAGAYRAPALALRRLERDGMLNVREVRDTFGLSNQGAETRISVYKNYLREVRM